MMQFNFLRLKIYLHSCETNNIMRVIPARRNKFLGEFSYGKLRCLYDTQRIKIISVDNVSQLIGRKQNLPVS